jgi:hypothetical protein
MTDTLSSVSQSLPRAIRDSWTRDTSYDPQRWSHDNPAWGQCAITALVVQDHLGGELLRAGNGEMTHFWNSIGAHEIDLTSEQFSAIPAWTTGPELVTRDYVLAWPATRTRYEALRSRVMRALSFR